MCTRPTSRRICWVRATPVARSSVGVDENAPLEWRAPSHETSRAGGLGPHRHGSIGCSATSVTAAGTGSEPIGRAGHPAGGHRDRSRRGTAAAFDLARRGKIRAAADDREHRPAARSRTRSTSSTARMRLKYMPSLFAAEAQLRRHAADPGDPHLGHQFQRPQSRLCRRHPDLRADRQQQHQRRAALGHGLARGDQGHRHALRPVLRRLSGQLDGRRAADHHAHAGQVRGDGQADRGIPDLRHTTTRTAPTSPRTAPARSAARSGASPSSWPPTARRASASRWPSSPTARRPAGTSGTIPALTKNGTGAQRRRRRRPAAQHHGQLQAQGRRSTSPTG